MQNKSFKTIARIENIYLLKTKKNRGESGLN